MPRGSQPLPAGRWDGTGSVTTAPCPLCARVRGRTWLSLWQILRFMGDPGLGGPQETLFGNYIVQKGLSVPGLRDELLAQAANQVWRNTNVNNEERGWLLLAACLSAFPPSAAFDKYLLK